MRNVNGTETDYRTAERIEKVLREYYATYDNGLVAELLAACSNNATVAMNKLIEQTCLELAACGISTDEYESAIRNAYIAVSKQMRKEMGLSNNPRDFVGKSGADHSENKVCT